MIGYAKRTLQRRLNELIEARLFISKGKGRARRYLLLEHYQLARSRENVKKHRDWLSSEAIKIRSAVEQALEQRKPIG